jgi:hypothetical protein
MPPTQTMTAIKKIIENGFNTIQLSVSPGAFAEGSE